MATTTMITMVATPRPVRFDILASRRSDALLFFRLLLMLVLTRQSPSIHVGSPLDPDIPPQQPHPRQVESPTTVSRHKPHLIATAASSRPHTCPEPVRHASHLLIWVSAPGSATWMDIAAKPYCGPPRSLGPSTCSRESRESGEYIFRRERSATECVRRPLHGSPAHTPPPCFIVYSSLFAGPVKCARLRQAVPVYLPDDASLQESQLFFQSCLSPPSGKINHCPSHWSSSHSVFNR